MEAFSFSTTEIPVAAARILSRPGKIIALKGPMGVGKTTLIKEMVRQLGGKGETNSPTYGIVNEYADEQGALLAYHFDFYRLETEEEAWDMGLEEYFEQNCYVFMEWPERLPNLLPPDTRQVFLELVDAEHRTLKEA